MIRAISIAGIWVYMGIDAIVDKQWCLWSYSPRCFEFGPFSNIIGSFFILSGIAYFFLEIRKRRREKRQKEKL